VVAVVETDAEDLVRPGDRRADALRTERLGLARGDPLGDRPGQRRDAATAEELLVEVGDQIGHVDVAGLVDPDDGLFGAGGADAHEKHESSEGVEDAFGPVRGVGRGGRMGAFSSTAWERRTCRRAR
jgi:hypothetical protein